MATIDNFYDLKNWDRNLFTKIKDTLGFLTFYANGIHRDNPRLRGDIAARNNRMRHLTDRYDLEIFDTLFNRAFIFIILQRPEFRPTQIRILDFFKHYKWGIDDVYYMKTLPKDDLKYMGITFNMANGLEKLVFMSNNLMNDSNFRLQNRHHKFPNPTDSELSPYAISWPTHKKPTAQSIPIPSKPVPWDELRAAAKSKALDCRRAYKENERRKAEIHQNRLLLSFPQDQNPQQTI